MTGSNRRPPPCKGGALPAELITRYYAGLLRVVSRGGDNTNEALQRCLHDIAHLNHLSEWWVVQDSNLRPID